MKIKVEKSSDYIVITANGTSMILSIEDAKRLKKEINSNLEE